MRKLVFSDGVVRRINEIVHQVDVETGVRIFGDIGAGPVRRPACRGTR